MNKSQLKKLTDSFIHWDITALTFLLPLFFLPITADFFDLNKKVLLSVSAAAIFIVWLIRNIITKHVRLTLTPALLPLSLLTIVSFVSLSLANINKTQGIMALPLTLLSLTLIYIVITSRFNKAGHIQRLVTALSLSGGILGLISILAYTNLLPKLIPSAPAWINSNFTPAGSPLNLLLFLGPVFILSLVVGLSRHQKTVARLIYLISATLMAVGLGLTLLARSDTNQIILLPLATSWEIAVENFKNAQTALIGRGPSSFIDSFTANKPISFNASQNWNLRFTSARNLPFQLLTTIGLTGLLSYLWLALKPIYSTRKVLAGTAKSPQEKAITAALLITVILQLFFPIGTLGLSLFIILLALQQTSRKLETDSKVKDVLLRLFAVSLVKAQDSDSQAQSSAGPEEILPWILGVPITLAIIIGLYLGAAKVYAGEITFKQSLDAAQANRGTDTYNLQIKAIQKNPREDRFHTSYALTNLALANSLASQKELSANDRNNIAQLLQQAVREAKVATQLNPGRTANWETLATVYRNLINVSEGADQWAIAAYVQAIRSNPNDPRLRLDLGGIYFGQQNYEQAIRFFEQAILLKNDWANAHFNLSAAYRDSGDLNKAVEEMRLVLLILDPASADYSRAQDELNKLTDKLGKKAEAAKAGLPEAKTELAEPSPLPTPVPQSQQIKLEEGSGPDIATESATPESVPVPAQ